MIAIWAPLYLSCFLLFVFPLVRSRSSLSSPVESLVDNSIADLIQSSLRGFHCLVNFLFLLVSREATPFAQLGFLDFPEVEF
ncbi:unnamed protein product [Rhodiola kirilowii]